MVAPALHPSSPRAASNPTAPTVAPRRRRWIVREPDPVYETNARDSGYEAEGSQHRTLGSIAVARDARWTAALTVPIPEADTVLIELERRGALPDGFRGAEDSTLLALPIGEIDALLALLAGITAAARRDGVLPSRS